MANYPKAIVYFIGSLLVSVNNDILSKLLSTAGLPAGEITFFRLSLGVFYLLGYRLYSREVGKATVFFPRQILRGALFVLASTLWTYGLKAGTISTATLMNFSIPIFILVLSPILLKEVVSRKNWIFSIVGLSGVAVLLWPGFAFSIFYSCSLIFLIAVLFFALLDIINKKYVDQESLFVTIFYPTCIALVLTLPSLLWSTWVMPSARQWVLLSLLGIGGNAILYLSLKAYRLSSIVSLAPLRYLELLFSLSAGYIFFGQIPGKYEIIGGVIIVPSVLFMIYDKYSKDSNEFGQF
ncbi:MAG: DMT family transporter [Bacteroidota bacterium]